MSKYELVQVTDFSRWDEFVESSLEGTVFSQYGYLVACGNRFELFFVMLGTEIKAGLALLLSDNGEDVIEDDLVIYNGLMFASMVDQKEVKKNFQRFEITEFVVKQLSERYKTIELSLSPFINDLRPFLWFNYHSPRMEDKFVTDLRYTSFLDISSFKESSNDEDLVLFKNMDTVRQRNLREGKRKNVIFEVDFDVDSFMKFYIELMQSQGELVADEKVQRMKNLISHLMSSGKAAGFTLKNGDGASIYKLLHCFDSKRAYYLFGAGDISSKERYKGTMAFWESFRYLLTGKNLPEIDMEGINSPRRGWFKLSFGGSIRQYFKVRKSFAA